MLSPMHLLPIRPAARPGSASRLGLLALLAGALAACAADVTRDETAPVDPPASATTDAPADRREPAPSPAPPPAVPAPPTPPAPLELTVLTYNVAGLPQGVSGSSPAQNTAKISPKLNAYELVVVQEDFSYHAELVSAATHPHQSTPGPKGLLPTDLGDGLSALSTLPFSGYARTKWSKCNGTFDQKNDCLTSKGFARMTLDVGGGAVVDVYNAHFDAGREPGDVSARDAQVSQLVAAIASQSAGRAVVVAGDTNMKATDEPTLQRLLTGAGLTSACRALSCPDPSRIDRVLYRSAADVKIKARRYAVESFTDAAGKPLSDHDPVSVRLSIER